MINCSIILAISSVFFSLTNYQLLVYGLFTILFPLKCMSAKTQTRLSHDYKVIIKYEAIALSIDHYIVNHKNSLIYCTPIVSYSLS
jgi:phosphatidylglycerophosphatase A